MKRLLLIATCLLNTLAFASGWNPEYDEDTVYVHPEPIESYEMGDLTWNRYVATKEDWTLEDAIAFEIAMPSHKDCDCENREGYCYCTCSGIGDYEINKKSGKSTLNWLALWMRKTIDNDEEPAFGCDLWIERDDLWNLGFNNLVRLYKDGHHNEFIQSKNLNDKHFVGFIEYRSEDYLPGIGDVPTVERIYLAKNGEQYILSTTMKNPTLQKHFFESFKILD